MIKINHEIAIDIKLANSCRQNVDYRHLFLVRESDASN